MCWKPLSEVQAPLGVPSAAASDVSLLGRVSRLVRGVALLGGALVLLTLRPAVSSGVGSKPWGLPSGAGTLMELTLWESPSRRFYCPQGNSACLSWASARVHGPDGSGSTLRWFPRDVQC